MAFSDRVGTPAAEISEAQLRHALEFDRDVTLVHSRLGFPLEIHWGVTRNWHPVHVPPQMLWERLGIEMIAGRAVRTHAFEDLLVMLCAHGATHAWDRIGWICDIAEIVRPRRNLDWSRVFETADAIQGRRTLLLGLALAAELSGVDLPTSVTDAIRADVAIGPLIHRLKIWLSRDTPVPLGERERFSVALKEHATGKVRVAMSQMRRYLALTPRDTEGSRLPRPFTRLLYLRRPIRLAREYGLTPFARFFRGLFQS